MKKQILSAALALAFMLLLASCTSTSSSEAGGATSSGEASTSQLSLSLAELAEYDGKDGRPAYVAVDGVIYDVSNANKWVEGAHQNGITAGKDLTDEIKDMSPHGLTVLKNLPVVGALS